MGPRELASYVGDPVCSSAHLKKEVKQNVGQMSHGRHLGKLPPAFTPSHAQQRRQVGDVDQSLTHFY